MKIKKNTFYIEGGDNVGKTTTIAKIKEKLNFDWRVGFYMKYNNITFSKYPTERITNDINKANQDLNQAIDNINAKILSDDFNVEDIKNNQYPKFNKIKKEIINNLIYTLLDDMKDSFTSNDIDTSTLNICDRGILSTYLYQYKDMVNIYKPSLSLTEEKYLLSSFIEEYIQPIYSSIDNPSNLNILILNNNNPSIKLSKSEETIAYKKNFDNNTKLQKSINHSLSNIINLINNDDLEFEFIRFNYINIYDEFKNRKSVDDICNEAITIFNSL